jgi:hypothetical protein
VTEAAAAVHEGVPVEHCFTATNAVALVTIRSTFGPSLSSRLLLYCLVQPHRKRQHPQAMI